MAENSSCIVEPIFHMTSSSPVVALSLVTIRDLSVAADIGVYAHEIGRPQTLVLNVTLHVKPVMADQISETIDYTRVVEYAEALARERTALIETFAYRLAEKCLAHPLVHEADVVVEKPGAIPQAVAGTRVVLRRADT